MSNLTINGQITVTIGRNIGDKPMPQDDWDWFQRQTHAALKSAVPSILFIDRHEGVGEWEGVKEESVKFTAIYDRDSDSLPKVSILAKRLARLAHTFGQDGIALSEGTSYVVPAADNAD